jgi:peptide-methionine (S)-S-oxide reductase
MDHGQTQDQDTNGIEVATLGGGCFWCLEAVYDELQGVTDVVSGYSGGTAPQPTYQQVCTGLTGHAEVIQIKFEPDQISFKEILQVFFSIHDPTTLNRQGADVGPQYRSVIFYHDQEQRDTAEAMIAELEANHIWDALIVTQVLPFETFFPAEDYHQEYYQNNPWQGYCRAIISPKVSKFRKQFVERMKTVFS